jgi:hypothetical protein
MFFSFRSSLCFRVERKIFAVGEVPPLGPAIWLGQFLARPVLVANSGMTFVYRRFEFLLVLTKARGPRGTPYQNIALTKFDC